MHPAGSREIRVALNDLQNRVAVSIEKALCRGILGCLVDVSYDSPSIALDWSIRLS
jgi:hypothetical protein